ncbi:uncharacterized protein LOC116985943 isoform X2 [Amblyraja radiata]|uniref:uncharacterized protein LOC116985943 isoform X2 n=1 Tax=Amblyraja radiata TaxID=386614 RepID=UPI00140351E5|nr:uncharacterized protein LOC116985943 isoform X2 [Amblyraja radiata]
MTGSREWVEKNFLKSMQGLNLSDLFALNPNFSGFEVLDLLTPQLLAELTVSPQAWFNADRIDQIFDTLTDRNFSDLDTYFTYFNYDTRMMNITTFANTTVRDRMLHRIIRLLQPLFSSFNASDFAKWFQDSLIMLLPSITGSNLGAIPTSISCESYRAIIQGLDNLYPNLSKSQLNDVYNFSRTFLNLQSDSHGIGSVPCTDNTTGLRDWLQKNFLKFVAEITFSDMPFINTQYYLFEILDLLSIPELSGLTVESLNHTSRINQIIDILRNRTYGDLIGYVTQFINDTRVRNITAIQPFSTSRAILTGIISQLRSYFTRFNGADFAEWFQDRLHLLLPAIDYKLLELIPTDISCESYQAIMKGLDNVYLHLTLAQNHDIYTFSKRFLSFQHSLSGSVGIACAENSKGTLEWIIKNFLRFVSEFQFHDFTDLNKNFSAFDVLEFLSAKQLAELTVSSDVLNNTSKITQILNVLISRDFNALVVYLNQFVHDAQKVGITAIQNPVVRSLMLSRIFQQLRPQFLLFDASDFIDWFQYKLTLLLSSITHNELDTIPTNITCESYQAIVKGLENVHSNLSMAQQEDISNFIRKHLVYRVDSPACTANTNGSIPWLLINFGRFRSLFTIREFLSLNKDFVGVIARELLTITQLGQLAGTNGALRDIDEVQKILSVITSDTVTEFVEAFRAAVNQSQVMFPPGVGAALLKQVLELSQSALSNASSAELWVWFGSRLQVLLPSLTEEIVPLVFVSKSCNGFDVIVTTLSSIKRKLDSSVQEAIYENILAYDKAFPLLCYENTSFVFYLYDHYQNYSEFLTLKDTFLQIPSNRLAEVLRTIDPIDFADLLSRPEFIDDDKILITVLSRYLSRQNVDTFVDNFNIKTRDSPLTGENRAALIQVFWTYFATVVLPENNDTEVAKWLNVRLQPYLPFITTELLVSNITLGIECLPYRKIVQAFVGRYADLCTIRRKEIYNGIRVYLQKGSKPKCYVANDTALNSTAWFVNYLGLFMNQMSLVDLQSFFDNEAQIQEFTANLENQALLESLTLSTEVSKFFINLLAKNNSVFNASSLPSSLVCFIYGTDVLTSLNVEQTLALIGRVNDVCGLSTSPNRTADTTILAEEQRKLSIFLVSKFDNFTVSTLSSFGQTAVGLSFSQIRSIEGNNLQEALPSLSKVKGWNMGQAKIIVDKLLKQDFQVNNTQNLLRLGSLVSGIPTRVFARINPEVFKELFTEVTFVENIGAAPQPIRLICVLQVLRSEKDPQTIVKKIPSVLAKEIPPALLNSDLILEDVNDKQWVPSQSAVFFERTVQININYDIFSPSVLQGFSCGAVKTLNSTSFIRLVQTMKEKRVVLDESQLRCIYFRQNSEKTPVAIDALPPDVLLYFNSANFRKSQNCEAFFKAVGKANINILPKGSTRRQNLLANALTCLKVTGNDLSRKSVTVLGGLVCDLTASVIPESDISILDQLKNCISYSESQKTAIEAVLQSGKTRYSAPSSWSSTTIYELGNLPLTLTSTWREVNPNVVNEALPRFIKKMKALIPPSDVLAFIDVIYRQLYLQKPSNAATNCTLGQITAGDINDLTPAIYDANQLNLCLSDRVLENNVLQLGSLSCNPSQLEVLKNRLLQIFPNGLPEDRIQLLGNISTVFNAMDVNSWNISDVDTLSELLMPQLQNTIVVSIITRYLQLGGSLNAVALKAIGGVNLCFLNESQFIISNLTDAGALDLSTCTQSAKDLLYIEAFSVLGSQQGDPIPYFNLIKAYIGGIPLGDLEALANREVQMDIATFTSLNPQVVKNLTAQNLINLLGYNVQALPSAVNETVLVVWVNSHFESEVSRLGLSGGSPDPTRERIFCADKDSSALNNFITNVNPEQFCNFNITEYACAKTDLLNRGINSDALTSIFDCFIGDQALNISDETALTVFLQKFNETTLNEALEKLNRKTPNTETIPLLTKVIFLNSVWDIVKTNENLTQSDFLAELFQERLRPFIAGITQSAVSPLLTRNLTCDGYQEVVKGLTNGFGDMSQEVRRTVLKEWIFNYLNTTAFSLNCYEDPKFVVFLRDSFEILVRFLTLKDVFPLMSLNIVSEILDNITPMETIEILRSPGFLDDYSILATILINISPINKLTELAYIFLAETEKTNFTAAVIDGIELEFSNSLSGKGNPELAEWLKGEFIPSLALITRTFFTTNDDQPSIPCQTFYKIVGRLSNFKEKLNPKDQESIHESLSNYAKAFPLHCYNNTSLTLYFKKYYQNYFDLIFLTDILTMVPHDRLTEVLENTDPKELVDLLLIPEFINDPKALPNLVLKIRSKEYLSDLVTEFATNIQEDWHFFNVVEGMWDVFNGSIFEIKGIDVREWLNVTLIPALPLISNSILNNTRKVQCFALNGIVSLLSTFKHRLTLSDQRIIYNNFLKYARAFPQYCFEDYNFLLYLKLYLQNYISFLTLRDLISLVPPDREVEVLNSIDIRELVDLLTSPGFSDDFNTLTKVVLKIKPIQNLTLFLESFSNATDDSDLLAAVMEGVWIWFTEALPELNDTEVDEWLNVRLTPYLPFIASSSLVSNRTLQVPCLQYRSIVKALNVPYLKINSEKRLEIYNGIRVYLLQGPKPKCYNASDPILKSSAWFSQYLGQYLSQASVSDFQLFSDNETLLQEFAANEENLQLLDKLTLTDEVAAAYINFLAKNNPNFNSASLPNSLLCFIGKTNLLQNLTVQQTLTLVRRINKVCGLNVPSNSSTDGASPPEEPTDEQLKLAVVLVSKIDNFSVSTLNILEQTAVGLSLSQVDNIDGNTLEQALPILSNVTGWNIGQANSIVNKLLQGGFQVNDTDRLLGLGSLIAGIPSNVFRRINPEILINVISNTRFVQDIQTAPQSIQTICVLQVLRNVNNPAATVRKIPSGLVQEIPSVLLTTNLSVINVNNKQWAPSQAAVFFQAVVKSNNNFETYSQAVLRGFSCGATKTLPFPVFLKLVQAVKDKEVVLDESQLECMAGRLTSAKTDVTLDALPADVLLFNYQYFRTRFNCREFFKLVGKSNVNTLRKVSARKQRILSDAKTCLGITGNKLTKESVTTFGRLVCELDGYAILASDITILDELKKCGTYQEDQKIAIEVLLRNGKSRYGVPSSWSSSTIQSIGNLCLALTDTWSEIDRPTLDAALPRFIKEIKKSQPREEVLRFIEQLKLGGRSNNTATCTVGVIAPEDINDLTPAIYNAAQLDLCLSDAVLKDNVLQLGSLAFGQTQLKMLKMRLLQIYSSGLPENQLQLLGNISIVFNVTEINSWNITRVETLSALLRREQESITVKAIITRYLRFNYVLNAVSLKAVGGGNLCILDREQLVNISNLTDAGALEFSSCPQSVKNLLYNQALLALKPEQKNPITYYQLIKAYIGGATTDDLKFLAINKVNMEFGIFKNLNPEEVQNLTAQNIIDLLGFNLQALRNGVNETVVVVWVASNNESEVRKLGLKGGIPDNSTEGRLCRSVNSSALNDFLTAVNASQLCNFNITQFACAEPQLLLFGLSSNLLSKVFQCFTGLKPLNRSDETALTVFIQKLNRTKLMEALDMFNNKTRNTTLIPLMTKITFLNALWEVVRTRDNLTSPAFLRKWFQEQFRPFIAGISQSVLMQLLRRDISCEGYRAVLNGLNYGFVEMPRVTRETVLRQWIFGYLNNTAFPLRCFENGSVTIYVKNYFQSFAGLLNLTNAFFLTPEVINVTDPRDLADVLSMPGFIDDNQILTRVLVHVQPIHKLAAFVDRFNERTQDSKLSAADRAAILQSVWPLFTSSLPVLNVTQVDQWLQIRLTPYLPFITSALLASNNSLRIDCLSYRKIVRTLNEPYHELTADKQREIYDGIKAYLLQGPKPKCYNVADPTLNSTAWFAQYLGLYMNQISNVDLLSFFNNESEIQRFAENPENLALLANLMLPSEVSKFYLNLVFRNNSNVNVSSLPDSLVCFIDGTSQTLSEQEILSVIEKVNQVCEPGVSPNTTANGTLPAEGPTDEQLQLAVYLVGKIDNFSVSTLNTLGQTAVGLSLSQVDNIDGNTLEQALPILSTVTGWNIGQANSIVNKLLQGGFQVIDTDRLLGLGSLIAGIPSNVFRRINPEILINVISNTRFLQDIQTAPQSIQTICVLQVLRNVKNPASTVRKIPSGLVKEIPPVLLTSNLSVIDVNNKKWTPSQAAVFFQAVVKSNNNFETFSPSVLQGFSCGAAVTLNDTLFLQLIEAMKNKRAVLDESQLSCMSYRLTSNGTPSNTDSYPDDLLLYFNSADFRTPRSCKRYFRGVGRSNIDLLRKGSSRRQKLLRNAFSCLGSAGRRLTRDDVAVLGRLSCDLPGTNISNCDITVLDSLKECTSYSDDQMMAIEFLLNTGTSRYGSPSSWSSNTVENDLGNLPLALTTTWKQVNRFAFKAALPRFIRKVKKVKRAKEVVRFLGRLRKNRRSKRATGCTVAELNAGAIDELIPVNYDAAQLEACLNNTVFIDIVEVLGTLDFDTDHLEVLKNKLSEIYPGGIPENQIQLLGNISTVFNVTEISSWNITQVETLAALMAQELENTMVEAIITKYLQSGGTLNAISLKAIGGPNLCILNESQLMTITELMNAGTLDISTCTQSKKNLLYKLSVNELASQANNTNAYFNLVKLFLGGASASDLRELANNSVNMDFATFVKLNPEEVMKFTVNELQGLLGINIPGLQTGANETVVLAWVNSHFVSEVRSVGLMGGIPDPLPEPELNFMCGNIIHNETAFCATINSSAVDDFLMSVNETQLCSFNITDYACAQSNKLMGNLNSEHLTTLFNCYTSTRALSRQDETALGIFVQKLDKTILNEALDKFNNKTQNTALIPLGSKITFVNALWEVVRTSENLNSSDVLTKWFQQRFRPFNAAISSQVLNCLLTQNITCQGYQAVLQGLNDAYGEMRQITRKTVVKIWILGYLNITGAGCISNTNGSRDWLMKNWGMFKDFVNIEDFVSLNSNFNAFDVLDILNPRHLSQLTVGSLNNLNNINEILNAVVSRNFTGLKEYMNYFVNNTQVMDIQVIQNTTVRDVMLNRIMQQLEAQFPAFNAMDYADWFQTKLTLLLPSIGSQTLALIPSNRACESNQAIIKGLDNIYPSLSPAQISTIYTFTTNYLSLQLNSTGAACTGKASESRDWILKNFGKFRSQSQYSELISLNSNFTGVDVVDLLTLRQLAQLSASNGILSSPVNVRKIMNRTSADNITEFMDIFSRDAKQNKISLAPEVGTVLLSEVLTRAEPVISTSNENELQVWLDTRLQLLIPQLNGNLTDILLTNSSCSKAQIIIRTLNARISEFPRKIQQQLYRSIRDYLQAGPKTRCYNATNPALNSTAWFANYIGKFLVYTSIDDLTLLTDSATLKLFTADQSNLNLLMNLNLPKDIQRFYASALFTNGAINVTGIPDSLVCFIVGTPSFESLNAQQALVLLEKANRACLNPSANGTAPTDIQIQLANALASKIDVLSSDNLVTLGQSAVGLSITQIGTINDTDVLKSLGTLGKVQGWTPGAANALVAKLISANFQFNNATNLLSMGSLVSGLSSGMLKNINNSVIVDAVNDSTFVDNILLAFAPSQQIVVQKIAQTSSDPSILLQRVPAKLATEIALPRLSSRDITLNLVNGKQWNHFQAAVFFRTLIRNSTLNFDDASPSVLQGFSCAAGHNLNIKQLRKFVKATRGKASLNSDQLICMSRRLNASGTPSNISDLPTDLLIFYTPEAFPSENCTSFFRAVGHSNINVVSQGSQVRKDLLQNAKLCLNISNQGLSRDQVLILNNLVCDYDGDITKADISILEALKNCNEYTPTQKYAINVQLNRVTRYGDPSTWNTSTLENLETLVFAVNGTTWSKVNRNVILEGLRPYVGRSSMFKINRQRGLLQRLFFSSSRRSRAATGCTIGEITASMTFDVMLPALYGATELENCLNNTILKDYLFQLGKHAFDEVQLRVLQKKLNQIYPNGIPEDKIQLLGYVTSVFNSTDINTWSVTKQETLSATQPNSPNDGVSKAILSRYLTASGVIDTATLNIVGGRVLCLLDESKIQTISPTNISNANPLNISSCSQSKINLIYNKAKTAVETQNSDQAIYYTQMRTYLGGATTGDLQSLASGNISMDPSVILALNPEEFKDLSTGDVKDLLGINLETMKTYENSTLVETWISKHTNVEVASLGIGLTGGNKIPVPGGVINIPVIESASPSINKNCLMCIIHTLSLSVIISALQTWLL